MVHGIGTGTGIRISAHLFLFLSLTLAFPTTPVHSIHKHEENEKACEFEPNGFIYCNCNDHDNPVDINCQIYNTSDPTMDNWDALAELKTVKVFVLINRPHRVLNYSLPGIVFSKMAELTYFKMKMASVRFIPIWAFSNSSSLSDIILEDNMIFTLDPFSFAFLTNLTVLNLAQNNIREIRRDVFVALPKLNSLILSRNSIQVIHDFALKDLGGLTELELQFNNLTVIARDVFVGLKNLKRIDLRYNSIELLGDHAFAELANLEDLDLQGNQIVSVSPTAFSGLKEMHRLNLQENKVVEFLPGTFAHFPKIHSLDLRSNRLVTLTKDLITPIYENFVTFTSMQFWLEGNRLKCDCRILWLQDLWADTGSVNVRTHLNRTECIPYHHLRRDDVFRKDMPVILVDDDDQNEENLTIPSEAMSVMSLTVDELKCPLEEATTTTLRPHKKEKGRKSSGGSKGKNRDLDSDDDKNLASLHKPDTRTESSSQSHQSNLNINIPSGSGAKVNEFLVNQWIVLAFLVFLN